MKIIYLIEVLCTRVQRLFRYTKSIDPIPDGSYCYTMDGSVFKPCKYYRPKIACTYLGHYGFDFCLYDMCKICGVKDDYDDEDHEESAAIEQ